MPLLEGPKLARGPKRDAKQNAIVTFPDFPVLPCHPRPKITAPDVTPPYSEPTQPPPGRPTEAS